MNRAAFEAILANVRFIMPCPPCSPALHGHYNVFHMRMEEDAVQHWSRMNNLTREQFTDALAKQYIHALDAHFEPSVPVLVLSGLPNDPSNPVQHHMHMKGYTIIRVCKEGVRGRELQAICDAVATQGSNGVFLGNFNVSRLNGSTFSYLVWQKGSFSKSVMVDVDRVLEPAAVIHRT